MRDKKYPILYVDDDESSIVLLKHFMMLYEKDFPMACCSVSSGREALKYLDGVGKYGDRKLYAFPMIILLDINMPEMNGFEVLVEVKKRKGTGVFPKIVMLSASDDPREISKAMDLGADNYLIKGGDYREVLQFLYDEMKEKP